MGPIVVIAASAGGLAPLRQIVATLLAPCPATLFVVLHTGPHPSLLPSLLGRCGGLIADFAVDGGAIQDGHLYVAPPDHHMLLEDERIIRVRQGPKVHHTRPAADPLFLSAAQTYGRRVTGIVLSGGGNDGATGLRAIKEHGGTALVQRPEEADLPWMPLAALAADTPEVLTVPEIAEWLRTLCSIAPQ